MLFFLLGAFSTLFLTSEKFFLNRISVSIFGIFLALVIIAPGFLTDFAGINPAVVFLLLIGIIYIWESRNALLPQVSVKKLLSLNLFFIYLTFALGFPFADHTVLSTLLIVVLILVLIYSLTNIKLPTAVKFILYSWFLVMSVLLLFLFLSQLYPPFPTRHLDNLSPLALFFSGMLIFYLISLLGTFFWWMIPWPDYPYPLERWKYWKYAVKEILKTKLSDSQPSPKENLVLLLVESFILAANYYFNLVPILWLMALSLLLVLPHITIIKNLRALKTLRLKIKVSRD